MLSQNQFLFPFFCTFTSGTTAPFIFWFLSVLTLYPLHTCCIPFTESSLYTGVKLKLHELQRETGYRSWIKVIFWSSRPCVWGGAFGIVSTYLQCEIEPLLAVSFIVQTFFKPQGASLLLLVTDHVELLLLVSSHNTKGQLGIFPSVFVLCSELQHLRTRNTSCEHRILVSSYRNGCV